MQCFQKLAVLSNITKLLTGHLKKNHTFVFFFVFFIFFLLPLQRLELIFSHRRCLIQGYTSVLIGGFLTALRVTALRSMICMVWQYLGRKAEKASPHLFLWTQVCGGWGLLIHYLPSPQTGQSMRACNRLDICQCVPSLMSDFRPINADLKKKRSYKASNEKVFNKCYELANNSGRWYNMGFGDKDTCF